MSGEAGRARTRLQIGQTAQVTDPTELIVGERSAAYTASRPGCTLLIQTNESGEIRQLRTAPEDYRVMAPSNGPGVMWEVERLPETAVTYQDAHVG